MADFIDDDRDSLDELQDGVNNIENVIDKARDVKDFIDKHSGHGESSDNGSNGEQSGGDKDAAGQNTEGSDSGKSESSQKNGDSDQSSGSKNGNDVTGNQSSQSPNDSKSKGGDANKTGTSDSSASKSGADPSSSSHSGGGSKEAAKDVAKDSAKEAGKEAGKEAAQQAAQEGAKQAAATAAKQAATTAASTASTTAATTAAGTVVPGVGNLVGLAVGLVWSLKDKIFKAVVTCSFMFLILLMAFIAALPTVVENLTFGLNGGKKDPGLDQKIEENYEEIAELIQKYIDKGYDATIDWIKDDIKKTVPGVTLSESKIKEILASGDPVYDANDTTQIVIKDLSLASRQSINPAFVMAVYSSSLNNTPHELKDDQDDDSVSEEEGVTKFTGTHKKDLKKKLKKKAIQQKMFPASRYGCQINTVEVEVVTYLPATYEVWQPITLTYYDDSNNLVTGTFYEPADPFYATTDVVITVPHFNIDDMVLVKKYSPSSTNGWAPYIAWRPQDIEYLKVEPIEQREKKLMTTYTYTIPPFDENSIYDAFGVSPFTLYEDGETYTYEVVETLQADILETIGKSNADYNIINVSKKITCTLTSEHGVLWYLFDDIRELERLDPPEDDPDAVWYENGLLTRRIMTVDEFKSCFDLSEWEYASQIQNISVSEAGRMTIRYQKTDPDDPTAAPQIAVAYIYSSKIFTIKTSSFVSPFYSFGADASIRSFFGYRDPIDGVTKPYHGGMDLGKTVGKGSSFFMPITATATGEVVLSEWTDYGNTVIIEHTLGDGSHIWSLYGHMACEQNMTDENYNHASSVPYVSVGQIVQQGEVIGHAGKTFGDNGYANGPHLHFEIRTGYMWGTKVDPLNYVDFSMNHPYA